MLTFLTMFQTSWLIRADNDYRYGEGTAGVHAVTSIYNSGVKKRTFGYDANGNMTSDTDHASSNNNREIKYAAFEKPVYIKKGTSNPSQITFRYGSSRERYRRIDNVYEGSTPVSIETTYLGAYEKVVHTGGAKDGDTEHKYYIGGVAIKIDTEKSGQPGKTTKTKYLLKDHLGSVVAIKDHNDGSEQRFRYVPFGKQYEVSSINPYTYIPVTAKLDITDRGFTGHEMLNSVDIIHMNGRIYDANIGRFMQADAYIQAPKNMQNMNRYAYVLNNPLSYTDPSGHFFKALKKYWRAIASIAIAALLPGAGFMVNTFGDVGAAIISGMLSGGVATGSLKGMITGGISAGIFFGIGDYFQGLADANANAAAEWAIENGAKNKELIKGIADLSRELDTAQQAGKVLSHALAGGVVATLNGDKFGNGFASAGITQAFAKSIDDLKSPSGKVLSASILGGTTSSLTGGKFVNGAITAAFSRAFNDNLHGYVEGPDNIIIRIYGNFEFKGDSAFEIHVYKDNKAFRKAVTKGRDLKKFEIGIIGPTTENHKDGLVVYDWVNKHKVDGAEPDLTTNQADFIKQKVATQIHLRGHLPAPGQPVDPKKWSTGLRLLGRFAPAISLLSMNSLEQSCSIYPLYIAC